MPEISVVVLTGAKMGEAGVKKDIDKELPGTAIKRLLTKVNESAGESH